MRIVIDMQGAQSLSRYRGIGRYSLSLALAIARNAGEHEVWLALNGAFPESVLSIQQIFKDLLPQDRIRIFEIPLPVAENESSNSYRMHVAEIIREDFLQQLNPDIVYISSLFEGYEDNAVTSIGEFTTKIFTAVTLYDLIPLLNPNEYLANEKQRKSYLRKIEFLKSADLLLAISESSRAEVINALHFPAEKVANITAAADGSFQPKQLSDAHIQQLFNRYGIARNMVMYAPGGFDWRKNFDGLIHAYSLLSDNLRKNHQLVIIGNIDVHNRHYLLELAQKYSLAPDELVITGYLPDDELVDFYNLATLFVFPSLHEGFGLPVLEAMACGAPAIGSNKTSIPEVIGMDAALFDPYAPEDIAKKISDALNDKAYLNTLRSHGLKHSKNFTWDECAKRTIKAFEDAVFPKNIEKSRLPFDLISTIAKIYDSETPKDTELARIAECLAFNSKRATHKQLLLDISVIIKGDAKSGIQRVVRSLMKEFLEHPPHNTQVRPIYFDGARYRYANAFTTNFINNKDSCALVDDDDVVDFCQDDIYLALDLNAHLSQVTHPLQIQLRNLGVKFYFIVYDILLVQHPEWWPQGTSVVFERWLNSISEIATGLICISEAVANEVRVWLTNNPPDRLSNPAVSSFHLGADIINSMPSKGLPEDAHYTLAAIGARPSFLMVGTIEPRKGHAQALSAFELLWKCGENISLVIVGKQGWLVDTIISRLKAHPEANKRLFWLEGVCDEYLEHIYSACTCLLVPSEGEGFGLPLIEAAQHNKPIIARDIPVFHEVAGDSAYYFNGVNPENLADAITNWHKLYQAGSHPKSDSMRYITWKESALQLCNILIPPNQKIT